MHGPAAARGLGQLADRARPPTAERTCGHAIFPLQMMNLTELPLHGGTFEALIFWGPSSFPRHAQVKSQEENEIGQHKKPGKTCCSLGWLTTGSASTSPRPFSSHLLWL